MTTYHIPTQDRRLGRHINHDPRSKLFAVAEAQTAMTIDWERVAPILDQGPVGSCTVEAGTGVLGTKPFVGTFTPPANLFTQDYIQGTLYKWETENDPYPGSWPSEDTGSDGLSAAKTMQHFGFINGYQHILSIPAAHNAIQSGPFIVGSDWMSSMDNPDGNGVVTFGGSVRGGHEYECVGYDLQTDLWHFVNSWGTGWGKAGHFYYATPMFQQLLDNGGDATVFVPLTQPAPTPTTKFTPDAADIAFRSKATLCTRHSKAFKAWDGQKAW